MLSPELYLTSITRVTESVQFSECSYISVTVLVIRMVYVSSS